MDLPITPDLNPDMPNVQIIACTPPIRPGCVAVVMYNIPIEDVNGQLVPCLQMEAERALEIANNIIYIARYAQEMAKQQS